jgi:hypothetical protein
MTGEAATDRDTARRDVHFIREVLARTQRRVDPRAFHFVAWGVLVLAWFPLANVFERAGRMDLYVVTNVGFFALGFAASVIFEWRLRGRERLAAESTFVGRQVATIVAGCITAGIVLSAAGPALRFLDGRDVPILWGLVYALMAFMVGVVYDREWLISGVFIFLGALVAMAVPAWNGVILGPVMGLGMIVPGLRAERRVRRLGAPDDSPDA